MPKSRKPQRTRLEKLQNSWAKASADERDAFLAWIGRPDGAAVPPAETGPRPITTGRYLTPEAAKAILARLAASGETLDDLKTQLGLEADDRMLARALMLKSGLRLAVVARLERWLSEEDRA